MKFYNVNLKKWENNKKWCSIEGFRFISEFISLSNSWISLNNYINEKITKENIEELNPITLSWIQEIRYKNTWKIFTYFLNYEIPINFSIIDIESGVFGKINKVTTGYEKNINKIPIFSFKLENEKDVIELIMLKLINWRIRTDHFLKIYFFNEKEKKTKFKNEILKNDILRKKFDLLYRIANYSVHPYDGEKITKEINLLINKRTSPHMYLWREQWNWMNSTMLFKQNKIVWNI